MALVTTNGSNNTIVVYENLFSSGGKFGKFGQYNDFISRQINSQNVTTVSFFDILDNG
jgi:hypothetical protein